MDVNKLVQYRMVNGELNPHSPSSDYSVKYVDKHNYLTYLSDIKNVSDIITKQIPDWKEAPTVEVVIERFVSNSYTYLFYYKNNCIGWNWGNPNFTYNWIDVDYQLKSNETYLGGCFVTNLIDRPANAGIMNYNMFFDECLKLGYNPMYGYCDDWNRIAIQINYSNGWKTYNFIKD